MDWFIPGNQILCVSRLEGIRGFVCIVYVRAKEGTSQLWEDRGWSDRYGRLPSPRKNEQEKGRNNTSFFSRVADPQKKRGEERLLYSDPAILAHHTVVPL